MLFLTRLLCPCSLVWQRCQTRRLSALEVLTIEIREAIMKITNSMIFSMASCVTLTQFLTGAAAGPVARTLGAISLYLVDRISFSPQAS